MWTSSYFKSLATWRYPHELASVGAADGDSIDHPIPLGNDVLDIHLYIGDRSAEHVTHLSEALQIRRHSRSVMDEVRCADLIQIADVSVN